MAVELNSDHIGHGHGMRSSKETTKVSLTLSHTHEEKDLGEDSDFQPQSSCLQENTANHIS